jgi:hypothetical protein
LWVENDLGACIIRVLADFPGLRQLGCIRRRVYLDQQLISEEIRYFVSSASKRKLSPKKFLKGIRGHWQVENSLHHVKDRSWHEDKMYSKSLELGWILAKLRNQALNIIRLLADKFGLKAESMPKITARLLSKPKHTLKLMKAL